MSTTPNTTNEIELPYVRLPVKVKALLVEEQELSLSVLTTEYVANLKDTYNVDVAFDDESVQDEQVEKIYERIRTLEERACGMKLEVGGPCRITTSVRRKAVDKDVSAIVIKRKPAKAAVVIFQKGGRRRAIDNIMLEKSRAESSDDEEDDDPSHLSMTISSVSVDAPAQREITSSGLEAQKSPLKRKVEEQSLQVDMVSAAATPRPQFPKSQSESSASEALDSKSKKQRRHSKKQARQNQSQ
ncbi:hypothetical protein BGZ94_005583 [Podila epigama]|nr:hypothetical protein BGZ94_005583 [Podila epigama]